MHRTLKDAIVCKVVLANQIVVQPDSALNVNACFITYPLFPISFEA